MNSDKTRKEEEETFSSEQSKLIQEELKCLVENYKEEFSSVIREIKESSSSNSTSKNINEDCKVNGSCNSNNNSSSVKSIEPVQSFSQIYSCHECLLLNYESANTKLNHFNNKHYNLTAEFLWIGERTNNINEAHVEFCRGLANPIGIKVSVRMNIEELLETIRLLNPENKLGKIVIITRVGNSTKAKYYLELLFDKIIEAGLKCLFICDLMHGNTEMINGYKTRKLENMIQEMNFTMQILKDRGLELNGIHLENTPFSVTECVEKETDVILPEKYSTYCDPRLNLKQSFEVVKRMNV